MQHYTIERLSVDNIIHLQALYRSCYSKKMSIEVLKGKYNTKIFGPEWIGYLALTSDNKPAAFYGVLPCRFRIRDETFLAAQSADTMTHPSHRKKGLFTQLAKMTYELARHEGIQFIFGFPNQNSYGGFVRLEWRFLVRPMQLFVLNGSKIPWANLFLKIPGLGNFYEKMMKIRFGSLVENGDFSGKHGVIRDQIFFKYKSQYSKTFVKKSSDIFAWMKNDGSLKIGFITFQDTTSPESLKHFLRLSAKRLGCHSIILMTSWNSQLYKLLTKITSPMDGLPIGFYNLMNRDINFDDVIFEYCDIDIF